MVSSAYYKCADCGQVLDRQKHPEDQPCPNCIERELSAAKTYRGSRARMLPGVTESAIRERAEKRREQDRRSTQIYLSNYIWAGITVVSLTVLLPYASPRMYRAMVESELEAVRYLSTQTDTFKKLSVDLMAAGELWPKAAEATAAAAPGGMLSYTMSRLEGGAAWCFWIALVLGLVGGGGVAIIYLRAIEWPDFRRRADLMSLAILAGLLAVNFSAGRTFAKSRAAEYHEHRDQFDSMLGMLVYAELREKNGGKAVAHLSHGAPRGFQDGRGGSYLHAASDFGVADAVVTLTEWGLDVNGKDTQGLTPLHYAAARGNTYIAEMLIDRGAQLTARDNAGRTLLHYAVGRKNLAILKSLLDQDLDVNAQDNQGVTPLLAAGEAGNAEAVAVLIEYGAHLETRDNDDRTLLQVTVLNILDKMHRDFADVAEGEFSQANLLQSLLVQGANPNVSDDLGQTPLHWLREARAKTQDPLKLQPFLNQLIETIVENGADYSLTDLSGQPAYSLHDAARFGHIDAAKSVVESGADAIDDLDPEGRTAFQVAVESNAIQVAELLLEHGADPNRWVSLNESALAYAVDQVNVDMVKLLLARGVSIANEEGREGPLLRAARTGSKEIVAALLDAGCNIDEHNTNGDTPLHLAAEKGHAEVVTLLLDRGADTAAWNRDGRTALDVAETGERKQVASILRRRPLPTTPTQVD